MDPESPANILAGGKLCTRKPNTEPNIMKAMIKSNPKWPCKVAIIPIVKKYIALIPPESPSNPSIKLIQLMHPKIKKIVNG